MAEHKPVSADCDAGGYDAVRRPEHSTHGDSMERFHRDPDAFTAGAQSALDRLLNEAEQVFRSTITLEVVDRLAARVLAEVHNQASPTAPAEPWRSLRNPDNGICTECKTPPECEHLSWCSATPPPGSVTTPAVHSPEERKS